MSIDDNIKEIQQCGENIVPFEEFEKKIEAENKHYSADKIAQMYEAAVKKGTKEEPQKELKPYQKLDKYGLPEGFPSKPLGKNGRVHFFLNEQKQVVSFRDNEMNSAACVRSLAGELTDKLDDFFPKWREVRGDDGERRLEIKENDFDATKAIARLLRASSLKSKECGIFDEQTRVRDAGSWRDDDGNLVCNYGSKILFVPCSGKKPFYLEAGSEIDGKIYTAQSWINCPCDDEDCDLEKVDEVIDDLKSWNWRDPILFPALMFGWVCCGFICGGPKFLPSIWVPGDRSMGKSTLLEDYVSRLMDKNIMSVAFYTPASIRRAIGKTQIPISIDENESDQNPQKLDELIKIVRSAVSESEAVRAGDGDSIVKTILKGQFLFSSIIVPPIGAQDLQRIALLSLNKLKPDAVMPDTSPRRLRELGSIIHRRMVNGWHRYKTLFETFSNVFAEKGANKRVSDVYGSMLICRKIAITDNDALDDEDFELIERVVEKTKVIDGDDEGTAMQCARHLLSWQVDKWQGGDTTTIGELIRTAGNKKNGDVLRKDANDALKKRGMRVLEIESSVVPGQKTLWLFVANNYSSLLQIFKDTQWRGLPGKLCGWNQALEYFPNAYATKKNVRIGVWSGKGAMVPFEDLGISYERNDDDD